MKDSYAINVNMILCMNNYVMSALGVWIGHVFKSTELTVHILYK